MSRKIFIGDVHGVKDTLVALVDKLALRKDDEIIFTGDLLDKGPDGAGVVRFVRELALNHQIVLVKGNHESRNERYRTNIVKNPEAAASMNNPEELAANLAALSPEDIAFLDAAPLFHRTGKYLVVHGGIPGSMTFFPHSPLYFAEKTKKEKKAFEIILLTRYVDKASGKMLPLGSEKPGDPFWAEVYDGRFGHVIFGHQPFDAPASFPHATGIDTGAVFGGTLTAMVVEEGVESFLSVPGIRYAKKYGEDD